MTDIMLVYLVIALAAARVAYLLAHDEITRPIREWIWLRWAPESATVRRLSDRGDEELPARMMFKRIGAPTKVEVRGYLFDPSEALRRPTFLGKLIECVYCVSFWIAVSFYLAYRLLPVHVANELWTWLFVPLAVWSVANWFAAKALG